MPAAANRSHPDTLTIRIERELKDEFVSTAKADNRPASEVLRSLMLDYISRRRRERFEAEAERQSAFAAESPDEEEVMRWIDNVSDAGSWR